MKILVVEHNRDNASLMKVKMIPKWGYESELASTGQEALVMLNRDLHDMVILDINFPDRKGYGLIPHSKKLNSDIYATTMTAHNSRDIEKTSEYRGHLIHGQVI